MVVSVAPADSRAAQTRLGAAHIPDEIRAVTQSLQDAGFAAVLVGGAIRDVLIGLPASDWDLATSATPSEVQSTFRRTVPTGIEHGTVTVLTQTRGGETVGVEVTTFRGEGSYADGRRPTEVTFLRDLREDLARRDFTVNALAWDPIAGVFSDPFGGLEDLRAGLIRAVGEPTRRFAEDGLRTMRAVRFCATRSLALEDGTRQAIPAALGVLDKVSRERVLVELSKLLLAPRPSMGLLPMLDTGIWPHVLPGTDIDEAALRVAIAHVDTLPAVVGPRLAALMLPMAKRGAAEREQVAAALETLKPSKSLRAEVLAYCSPDALQLVAAAKAGDAPGVRQAASGVSRDRWEAAVGVAGIDEAEQAFIRSALSGAALGVGELALRGRELIEAGVLKPGPAVGQTLRALLAWVHEDPTRNEREALLSHARGLAASQPC